MLGQTCVRSEKTSLALQVETDKADASQDGRNRRFLLTGLGFAALSLIGLAACALHPLASHASVRPTGLDPSVAFIPSLPALAPGGLRPAQLPARVSARPTSFRPAMLPRMSQHDQSSSGGFRTGELLARGRSRPANFGPARAAVPPTMRQQDPSSRGSFRTGELPAKGFSRPANFGPARPAVPTSRVSQREPLTRMSMSKGSTQGEKEDVTMMVDQDTGYLISDQPLKDVEEAERNHDAVDAAITDDDISYLRSIAPKALRVAIGATLVGAGLPHAANAYAATGPYSDTTVWLLQSCIPLGVGRMGLPGLLAQFFFLSPLSTFKKIWRDKSVGKLPLLPYSSMFVNGLFGFSYGQLLGNPAIWLCNVPPMLLGAAYTAIFYKNAPSDADWLPGTAGNHILAMISSVAFVGAVLLSQSPMQAINIIGLAVVGIGVVMFSGPLAAIRTVLREKSTASLPFPMMVATVITTSLWTFYGAAILEDPVIWFPNMLGLLSGLVQAALFWRFGFALSGAASDETTKDHPLDAAPKDALDAALDAALDTAPKTAK